MSVVIPSLRAAVAVPGWAKNVLWRNARAVPSLDLRFADNKSLVDAVTGASLITFTRASSGAFVDSAGVLQTAATDVPRFDHNPTTGESLGLLVEEARTNLLLRSEEFDTTWLRTNVSAFGSGSAVNVETAPDGTLTADLIAVANGFNSGTGFVLEDITKAATSTTYTVTTFAKAQNWNAVTLHAHDVATNNNRATVTFSLATGVITTAAAAVGTFSAASAITATPFIDGWFRVNLTFTSSTETGLRVRLIPNNSTTVTSDGTNGIYLWGGQLEADAFPSSYIPTTTATVTRAADVASITGSNFSSWYQGNAGTLFFEGINPATSTTAFAVSDGSVNNRLQMDSGTNNRISRVVSGGTTQAGNSIAYTYGTSQRFAMSYATDSINFANAGTLGIEDTSATIPTVDQVRIGANPIGAAFLNSTIRRITYWPQALPSQLQALTQ